jgi:hypothetical protein
MCSSCGTSQPANRLCGKSHRRIQKLDSFYKKRKDNPTHTTNHFFS